MIVGIGADVVDLARFAQSLVRTPSLRERLFTPAEGSLPDESLAARFAAKEALAKALGAPAGLSWQDAEVVSDAGGRPQLALRGGIAEHAARLGVHQVHLTLSHDAGVALAFVVLEGAASA